MSSGSRSRLPRGFYLRDAESVARDLLGRWLLRRISPRRFAVTRILETEAYLGAPDRASHAFGGRRTERTSTMYREGGVAYVYLIYGLHNCLNVVAGPEGEAQAVLIRAVEPLREIEWMVSNRGLETAAASGRLRPGQVGGGPGKLCQALAVDRRFDGTSLRRGDLVLAEGAAVAADEIASGPRIGVDYAGEAAAWPLRFAIRGHREMSRPLLR